MTSSYWDPSYSESSSQSSESVRSRQSSLSGTTLASTSAPGTDDKPAPPPAYVTPTLCQPPPFPPPRMNSTRESGGFALPPGFVPPGFVPPGTLPVHGHSQTSPSRAQTTHHPSPPRAQTTHGPSQQPPLTPRTSSKSIYLRNPPPPQQNPVPPQRKYPFIDPSGYSVQLGPTSPWSATVPPGVEAPPSVAGPMRNPSGSNVVSAAQLPKRTTIAAGTGTPAVRVNQSDPSSWTGRSVASPVSSPRSTMARIASPESTSPARGPRLISPEDRARTHALLDEGNALFHPPECRHIEAFFKWQEAAVSARQSDDAYNLSRALSNMGCAARAVGLFKEDLALQQQAWLIATALVRELTEADGSSLWLEIAARTLELDGLDFHRAGQYIDSFDVERTLKRRTANMRGFMETASPVHARPSLRPSDPADPTSGPPIVVWFMDLTTNLGNAHFNLGEVPTALDWHSKCLELAESVLEEAHLPQGFSLAPSDIAALSGSLLEHERPRVGPTDARVKLSYLHRATLLAQARALTHLGVCCQHLGLDDNSFQCHRHAASLLSFYSSRSLSFAHAERRGAAVRPHAQAMDGHTLATTINLATALHARGRVPEALTLLSRARQIASSTRDGRSAARVAAATAAVRAVSVGGALTRLHWLRNMDTQARGSAELEECRRYWGPPRLSGVNTGLGTSDESAAQGCGSGWIREGLVEMALQGAILRRTGDVLGALTARLNMASAYLEHGHPLMALRCLNQMVLDPIASSPTPREIPRLLSAHVTHAIAQSLILLGRIEGSPEVLLDEPLQSLLAAAGLEALDPHRPEPEIAVIAEVERLDELVRERADLLSRPGCSVLFPYVGAASGPGPTGTGGVDIIRTLRTLALIGSGKHDWLAGGALDSSSLGRRLIRPRFRDAADKWGRAVRDALQELVQTGVDEGLEAQLASMMLTDPASGQVTATVVARANGRDAEDGGPVTALHDLVPVVLACVAEGAIEDHPLPPIPSGMTMPQYRPAVAARASPLVHATRASLRLWAPLLALCGDSMAHAAALLQTDPETRRGVDLLALLDVRRGTGLQPAIIHRDLLAGARAAYEASLGLCEGCMRRALDEPDFGCRVAFELDVIGDPNGLHLFPCRHQQRTLI